MHVLVIEQTKPPSTDSVAISLPYILGFCAASEAKIEELGGDRGNPGLCYFFIGNIVSQ